MSNNKTKLAEMLQSTRKQARISQESMAEELGVARKTVQNWEYGVTEPSAGQLLAWFEILGVSPYPHLLGYMHPKMERLAPEDSFGHLKESLLQLISTLPEEGIRQLLYILYGDHGSSPRAVLNLVTAHLQTPLEDRIMQAGLVVHGYEMAEKTGKRTSDEHVQPDIELLKKAIKLAEEAVARDADSYNMGNGN